MKIKTLSKIILLLLIICITTSPLQAMDSVELEKIKIFHENILTIDTHVDIPNSFGTKIYDPMIKTSPTQKLHLSSMIKGGLDAVFLIVYVQQNKRNITNNAKALSDAFLKFHAIHKLTKEQYPDKIGLALSPQDIIELNKNNKKIALIGIENGFPMGGNLELLQVFYNYGARYFGLLHDGHNDLGDSARPQKRLNDKHSEHNGLSELGLETIKRLNQLGMIVDISHSSEKSSLDVLKYSAVPVIASHSGVDGILNHPRNMSDKELIALKNNDGVIQVVAFGSYLQTPKKERIKAIDNLKKNLGYRSETNISEFDEKDKTKFFLEIEEINKKFPVAAVSNLVDQIDYVVSKIGINHVGISSDFNGGGGIDGWSDPSETINITIELLKRGYKKDDIRKIWGGNFLRVFREVESYAVKWKKNNASKG